MMSDLSGSGVHSRVSLMVSPADFSEAAGALDSGPVIVLRKPVLHEDVVSILTLIAK